MNQKEINDLQNIQNYILDKYNKIISDSDALYLVNYIRLNKINYKELRKVILKFKHLLY